MSVLKEICQAVEGYNTYVLSKVEEVRANPKAAAALRKRWHEVRANIGVTTTPTGLSLPRLALPEVDEAGEIARYLYGEGLPGEFPFVNSTYRELYLAPNEGEALKAEEPTRLFAGLGLAEDTNERFHYLTRHQRNIRLSTAFDSPTLYGLDSDTEGIFGKIGEGGVAIDTIEDMERMYDGFDLAKGVSVSMTINGPAPVILAMFVAAAKRRHGPEVVAKLRGTLQADILKEVQGQNEIIFPLKASLRFLTDMVEWTTAQMPRWYPISISGYHIAEAGATPVQQAAYTLSNGFAYVEMFRERGLDINQFGPRLSFFLDCGLDIEYLALTRVCRKLWAIGMREVFGAEERAQLFKVHTQTSGRSLIANEYKNNLTRTTIELMMACANATNSCHSNSADEPFTTPSEEYARLAAHGQAILLEESGLFKHMMNTLSGSPGMKVVEKAVETAILAEFREVDRLGGVIAALEQRYQRSQIQASAHRYEKQIYDHTRPIIGLNRYASDETTAPKVEIIRTAKSRKEKQIRRLALFKRRHAKQAATALDRLSATVETGGNVFAELLDTVEVCSLGQITNRLFELVGRFRPSI